MKDIFLEAINAPAPGWPGRRRYIAGQVWRMFIEGLAFVLVIAAFLGAIVITYFAMNLPVPS